VIIDVSGDGVIWTDEVTITPPFELSQVNIGFGAEAYAVSPATVISFDNVNILP
jgi:hypothetical protein